MRLKRRTKFRDAEAAKLRKRAAALCREARDLCKGLRRLVEERWAGYGVELSSLPGEKKAPPG